MLISQITFFGQKCLLVCDAKCNKAWGIPDRPFISLSDDPDDRLYLADRELDAAPIDPGSYEGSHAKPRFPEQRHNKWCTRACERSVITKLVDVTEVELPDWSMSRKNKP